MNRKFRTLSIATMFLTLGITSITLAQQTSSKFQSSTFSLKSKGTVAMRNLTVASNEAKVTANRSQWNEIHYRAHSYGKVMAARNQGLAPSQPAPAVTPLPVTTADSGFSGFSAVNGAEQAAVEGFDLEPPDQGLCTDGNVVVEAINLALAVYDAKTHKLLAGPVGLNPFFGTNGFLSDPRCYYDPPTQRWILTLTEVGDPSAVVIAVSVSSDATDSYSLYSIDTTNDGTLGECPCFGDQPLLGADTNGIYISTNAYSLAANTNPQAQIYAISKFLLIGGAGVVGQHVIPIAGPGEPYPFSIGPALSPDGQGPTANGGTEYLMASDQDFNSANDVVLWALTNTSSLGPFPALGLSSVVLSTQAYAEPPNATQKKGSIPLGKSVGVTKVGQLDSDDGRMSMPLYWANGQLWAAINTAVQVGSNTLAGIAYFIVQPSWKKNVLGGSVVQQGYVVAEGTTGPDNTIYPAIGVTDSGSGEMVFTLSGPDYFPSAAYVPISTSGTGTAIRLAGKGVLPDDGFSIYPAFGGSGVGRWGDYSWAVATGNTIWMATEYIGPKKRDQYTNWGTFIGSLTLP